MRRLVFCVVLAAIFELDNAEPRGRWGKSTAALDAQCEPHTTWTTDCKICKCDDLGYATCGVSPDPMCSVAKDVDRCKPGSKFRRGCSTCVCDDNGIQALCSLETCAEYKSSQSHLETPSAPQVACTPGSTWVNGCFKCSCDEGQARCEKTCDTELNVAAMPDDVKQENPIMFPKDIAKDIRRSKRATPQEQPKKCQPAREFRIDCNNCLCDTDGQSYSCTRINCREQNEQQLSNNGGDDAKSRITRSADSDPNFRCTPGEQLKRGCNQCTCSADGKSVFCSVCEKDIPKI